MHIVKDIMLVLMEGNYGYMYQIDHMHTKPKIWKVNIALVSYIAI